MADLPTYFIRVVPENPELTAQIVEDVPGVFTVKRGNWRGALRVPYNAGWLVCAKIQAAGHTYAMLKAPPEYVRPNWSAVKARLREQGEAREAYLEDFPTSYQKIGVCFTAELPGGHLWWPGGAGKTFSLILWLIYCRRLPAVIVTKAAARGQWKTQIERFTTPRPWVAYPKSSKEARKQPTLEEYVAACYTQGKRPVIILSWPTLGAWSQRVAALCQQTYGGFSVGFDESHIGKSYRRKKATLERDGSTTFEDLGNLSDVASKLSGWATRRLCTTATPVKDRFRDLWAQADLTEPGCYGGFSRWSKRYTDARPGAFGGMDTRGESNVDEFLQRISFSVHRTTFRETHGSLPPKRRQSIYIPPEEQNRGWTAAKLNAELKKAAPRGATAIMEVQLSYASSLKRDVAVDLIVDAMLAGQKVLVLDTRTENVDTLYAAVTKACAKIFAGKNSPLLLAGYGSGGGPHQTSPEARERMRVAYWDSEGATCLIGTGDAWGTAYDLHDTDIAIFMSRPWTGGDFHQWEQRVSRQGQKRPVLILFPVAEGTVDEHVIGRLIEKLPAMEKVAGDVETASAHAALTGTENREALSAAILKELEEINYDNVDD